MALPDIAGAAISSSSGVTLASAILTRLQALYVKKNQTAKQVLDHLCRVSSSGKPLVNDHVAFRSFNYSGYGISSLSNFFTSCGYKQEDELRFPKKHLRALWYSPPPDSGVDLPRVFISELLVEELSERSQTIISSYLSKGVGMDFSLLAAVADSIPWPTPTYKDYQELLEESQYAAWTLVHGCALNHQTISIHNLSEEKISHIKELNNFLKDAGFRLNQEGGELKISPDGGLLQSSTVADTIEFQFADGENYAKEQIRKVAGSYIEFAERLVLPEYSHIPLDSLEEKHRRDGFEVGNADGIFDSTKVT